MEAIYKLESYVYPIRSPRNGMEYWEIKFAKINDTYFGGAQCLNFDLSIDFRNLDTRDESVAIDTIVSTIKENLV
ncbi:MULTISPECIES: hypothetical protein [Bacillus cereus group]|uniref:hypothetical protein n=1 Tax=Bacillus cereus group TaxID=86661 RepID=UPI0005394FA3|nr:hypothetical protein [Bacillus cereus]MEC0072775.1 hypothetical protein [Bacillus cereus]PEY32618.1 hypothetical protein CN347_21345 [Bacillus cereus]PFK19319.1 hypothetical protein COJ03_23430 [Bacillus cereus]PGM02668.1 hypothetical protein CN935_28025 [Bacillus cereus]PGQ20995.1 hypothetical protein COA13_06435 [Bacillus cereus]